MYDIKNPDVLKDLLLLLADRTGQQAAFTKLGHILGIKNDTVKEYIYYLPAKLSYGAAFEQTVYQFLKNSDIAIICSRTSHRHRHRFILIMT